MSVACDDSNGVRFLASCSEAEAAISRINKVNSLLSKKCREIRMISVPSLPKDRVVSEDSEPAFVCSIAPVVVADEIVSIIGASELTEDVLDAIDLLEEEYCELEQEIKQLKDYVC